MIQFLKTNAGVSESALRGLREKYGSVLPDDYVAFLQRTNGAASASVEFYPAEEVVIASERCGLSGAIPGLIVFGGDGGNELFAFDVRELSPRVVMIPLVGMRPDNTRLIATSFTDFLKGFG